MWGEAAAMGPAVGRLTIRAPGLGRSDAIAVRQAVSSRLQSVDLAPPATPPSSILVIRRLGDPLPGSFAGGSHSGRRPVPHRARPFRPGRIDPRWQQALRSRLADEARRAARPVLGRLDPSAPAVCFRDESELLACLALDRVAGRVGERWWWHTLLAVRPELRAVPEASDRLADLFRWHRRRLPAVFDQLDAWGRLGPVAGGLTESAAGELLDAVVEEFALDSGLRSNGSRFATAGRVWLATGASGSGLAPQTARLVYVTLAVQRRPSRSRTRDFAREVEAWWRGETARSATTTERRPRSHAPRISQVESSGADRLGKGGGDDPRTAGPASPGCVHSAEHDAARHGADPGPAEPAAPASDDAFGGTGHAGSSRGAARGDADRDAAPEAPPRVGPDVSDHFDPGRTGTATEAQGGLSPDSPTASTVIHAAEAHDARAHDAGAPDAEAHSADIQTDAGPDLEPQPRIGIETNLEAGIERDTETGTETDTETGIETRLGGVFYLIQLVPHLDLGPEQSQGVELSWTLIDALARGLLADADGVDRGQVPADPIWSVLAEIDGRRPGEPPDPSHPATRFAESHSDEVGARLVELLDAARDEERDARDNPIRSLLAVPARIYVTRTHVDVVMALDHISLPARRAGLDRDPGWVRELGRVVLFHFE